MNATMTYPALNGEIVTKRHARICREQGHATHTVDGVDTGICPRCGDITVTVEIPTGPVEFFDLMLKLEGDIKTWKLQETFGRYDWDRGRGYDNRIRCQRELDGLFGELSMVELAAFGAYRASRLN